MTTKQSLCFRFKTTDGTGGFCTGFRSTDNENELRYVFHQVMYDFYLSRLHERKWGEEMPESIPGLIFDGVEITHKLLADQDRCPANVYKHTLQKDNHGIKIYYASGWPLDKVIIRDRKNSLGILQQLNLSETVEPIDFNVLDLMIADIRERESASRNTLRKSIMSEMGVNL